MDEQRELSRAVRVAAALNAAYFLVEFSVAYRIGSVSLFADSIDFLEDTALNLLILLGLSWSARNRAKLGMVLAVVLLVPALATIFTAWQKFHHPTPPEPGLLTITGIGAMVVNLSCALVLARVRTHAGSLTKAAFLSARNDVLANVAIVLAGVVTYFTGTVWPDVIVGLGIAAMNADAAREVFGAARAEHGRS